MGNTSQYKWSQLMILANGIVCVPCSSMIPSSSFMLLNFLELSTFSTMLVMQTIQLRLVTMMLGVREESFTIKLTLNSHGGFPCNKSIVVNTQNLKCTKKIMQNRIKLVNSISQCNLTSSIHKKPNP